MVYIQALIHLVVYESKFKPPHGVIDHKASSLLSLSYVCRFAMYLFHDHEPKVLHRVAHSIEMGSFILVCQFFIY